MRHITSQCFYVVSGACRALSGKWNAMSQQVQMDLRSSFIERISTNLKLAAITFEWQGFRGQRKEHPVLGDSSQYHSGDNRALI